LEEMLNADLLPTLRREATPRNIDTSKHCRFHQNYGHSTEECVVLRDKIGIHWTNTDDKHEGSPRGE